MVVRRVVLDRPKQRGDVALFATPNVFGEGSIHGFFLCAVTAKLLRLLNQPIVNIKVSWHTDIITRMIVCNNVWTNLTNSQELDPVTPGVRTPGLPEKGAAVG